MESLYTQSLYTPSRNPIIFNMLTARWYDHDRQSCRSREYGGFTQIIAGIAQDQYRATKAVELPRVAPFC